MEFTEEQWLGLADHCRERELIFLSSPFSLEAVGLLSRVGVAAWKVASGEVTNVPMLERMAAVVHVRRLKEGLPSRWLAWILLTLFIASLLVRAMYLVSVTGVDRALEGDEGEYHGKAVAFVNGDGWGSEGTRSDRPPLITLQLSLVYFLTGSSTEVGRWMMVFYSSLVAPVLFIVTRRLVNDRNDIALLVAGAWVVYPPSIWYSGRILTETTTALLVVASLGAFLWAAKSRSFWPVILTGVLWGLLVSSRSSFLLLPLALMVAQFTTSRLVSLECRWARTRWALALVGLVIVLAPWTVRNMVIHGVFLPTESRTGYALLLTNGTLDHPSIQAGSYYKNPELLSEARHSSDTEIGKDSAMRSLAIDEIKRNWRLLPRPIFNSAKNFWTTRPDPYDSTWTTNDWIMLAIWGPTLAFFAASSLVRSWRHYWPALLIILYAFIFTLPFWGTPRFRFPVDAVIVTGAAVGFLEVSGFVRSVFVRRYRQGRMSI